MKLKEVMHRISIILSQARRGGFTWEFLLDKMEVEFEIQGMEGEYSIRTFQRDLTTIREVYGIDIQFNKRLKKYLINGDDSEPIRMHLLESLDIINAFELASDLGQFVFFDGRRAGGTEHLSPLIGAIKKRVKVRFRHFKNWIETDEYREVSPLALKQVKYSWYLIALNEKEELRNYGLDRIHDLSTTSQKFERPEDLNLKEYYQHVFGILNNSTLPVENIVLHFSKEQGHYIKSMPIHPSQIIGKDDENGLIVSLQLKINHELISEILSYGDQVKVLEPRKLRDELSRIVKSILI